MGGEFKVVIIQDNIPKAQEEIKEAMVKVYRLQQIIVDNDQHIMKLQAEVCTGPDWNTSGPLPPRVAFTRPKV
jgi:hypothetical protein